MECQRKGSGDGGQRARDRSQRARGAPGPYHSLAVWLLASYRAFTSSSANRDQYLLLLLIHGACEGSEEIISLKVSEIEKHLIRIHILCHLTSPPHCLPCFPLCSVFQPCRPSFTFCVGSLPPATGPLHILVPWPEVLLTSFGWFYSHSSHRTQLSWHHPPQSSHRQFRLESSITHMLPQYQYLPDTALTTACS